MTSERESVLREFSHIEGSLFQRHAMADEIATLRTALADARRERDEALLRVQHVGMECADKLMAAEREREAMRAVVEAAETLADALHEVEETHASREPSDGERRHLMGIVSRATREIEFTVRSYRTATKPSHAQAIMEEVE